MSKIFVFFLTVISLNISGTAAMEYSKAEVYYHDWSINVRSRMSVGDVRNKYLKKLVIRDSKSISLLLNKLPINAMTPVDKTMANPDIRLVIDLFKPDGSRDSFSASRFYFFDEKHLNAAKLPPQFSQEFQLGIFFSAHQ